MFQLPCGIRSRRRIARNQRSSHSWHRCCRRPTSLDGGALPVAEAIIASSVAHVKRLSGNLNLRDHVTAVGLCAPPPANGRPATGDETFAKTCRSGEQQLPPLSLLILILQPARSSARLRVKAQATSSATAINNCLADGVGRGGRVSTYPTGPERLERAPREGNSLDPAFNEGMNILERGGIRSRDLRTVSGASRRLPRPGRAASGLSQGAGSCASLACGESGGGEGEGGEERHGGV
jgi:hypothetical protein